MAKRKTWPVWVLVVALIVVIGGGILFALGVSGVLGGQKTTLDPEYYAASSALENSDGGYLELINAARYGELTGEKKSFLVFVDQNNCTVAERLKGYMAQYIEETGVKPYRMMFSEVRNSPLHDQVKYYPSVVIVRDGTPVAYLDPSSDADAEEYNDYNAFRAWLEANLAR